MRVLVYSDLQADEGSVRLRSDPTVPLQRWRVQRFYELTTRLVRSHGIDAVWDLGDTTNNRASIAHPTLQVVSAGCAALTSGMMRPVCFKLLGNHEQHAKDVNVHCGELFAAHFHVVIDRGTFDLPGDVTVVCVSHQYDNVTASTWIAGAVAAARARGRRVIVLGHFTVRGCRLNSGVAHEGIATDALRDAHLTLLGHVHRRQLVATNAFYVGSPFQQDFGEANDPPKAVAVLDTDTLELTWVHLDFPRYRTILVDELTAATATNDVLAVTVRDQAEAERFYAHPASGLSGVEPVYAFTAAAQSSGASIATDTDLIAQYVASNPVDGIEPGDLLRAAHSIHAGQ